MIESASAATVVERRAVERAAVAHQLLPVEQPGAGGVDDAVAAADEQHRVVLDADDRDAS